MRLTFLGASREVGRSAILVESNDTSIVMDYGLKQAEPPIYPLGIEKTDAVILSHSHLDHCGSLPLLYRNSFPPLFGTELSLAAARILIKDSIKVARKEGYTIPFDQADFKAMIRASTPKNYEDDWRFENFRLRLFDAGHIPGSSSIMLRSNQKSLFYSGDIKLNPTQLLDGCKLPDHVDNLVIESTYSQIDHPKREDEEARLISAVDEALELEENVLLPVFAVGRAQEVLLILENYADKIALDGMAKLISELLLDHPEFVKDSHRLRKVLNKVAWIRTVEEREKAMEKYPVIVTTAAMMGGGPVLSYLKNLHGRPEAKIIFTGYIVEDTPAKDLIKTGILKTAEEEYKVHCDITQLDLSAHAGRTELFEIIDRMKPQRIFCIHGENCDKFAKELESKGYDAVAPEEGESFEL